MDALQEQLGRVSVWLGHFEGEEDWEAYLEEQYEDEAQSMNAFAAEFGLGFYYDHDQQEANFTEQDVPVGTLLADNSYAASFLAGVVEAANKVGIVAANVSLLLYDSVYQPSEVPAEPRLDYRNRLRFVGVFAYDKP